VFGLRQQIGGDPVGIAGPIGEDQHLRGAGDHVDADFAEHDALGGGDVHIARPDDLGDRRDGRGAVSERRDRLRAADAINLVDAGDLRRRQNERRDDAAGRRHGHNETRHAGDLGRHGIHQQRGRISRAAAGDIEPDRFDGGPTRTEFDAQRIGEALVPRHLPAVKRLDAVAGEVERVERVERGPCASGDRGVDLALRHLEPGGGEIEAVEFLRVVGERPVAAGGDIGDNGADRGLDVGCGFALSVEKRAKLFRKIGGACVEAYGHC